MKRLFDILAAACGLILTSPLLAVIGIMVRRTSGSPVLFRQIRVGQGGRDFILLKFRTMRPATGSQNGSFDVGCTSRVTAIGLVLRKWKLDELPQLWNVLKGDMSLVGPRPEVRKWVETYPARWPRVLTVRPGITDPASILYRNEEEILAASPDPERMYREVVLPHKFDLYDEYVRTQSFMGDLCILFKTLWVVARGSARPNGENT